MIDKRIATYFCELVLDPKKMEEFWRDKRKALRNSGLTPDQQNVVLVSAHDPGAIGKALKAIHEEHLHFREPLVGEFHWPIGPPSPGGQQESGK